MTIPTGNTGIAQHMSYIVISSCLFISKCILTLNKEKVFLYLFNQAPIRLLSGKTWLEKYTKNVANRIPSLAKDYYTCFSFFELAFWMLATRDKHDFLHVQTRD